MKYHHKTTPMFLLLITPVERLAVQTDLVLEETDFFIKKKKKKAHLPLREDYGPLLDV